MMLDRVLDDFRVVFQLHLLQKTRAMRPYGFHAEIEFSSDVTRRLSCSDEAQHLKLAVGEPRMPALAAIDEVERHALGEFRRKKTLAARPLADGGHEVGARRVLADVSESARLQ